jgi:hypothetical protein
MHTLTPEHQWTEEVLIVAAGVQAQHGIPRGDAIEIARQKVRRWGGYAEPRVPPPHTIDLTTGTRPAGKRPKLLELGDAAAWVWVRA